MLTICLCDKIILNQQWYSPYAAQLFVNTLSQYRWHGTGMLVCEDAPPPQEAILPPSLEEEGAEEAAEMIDFDNEAAVAAAAAAAAAGRQEL